MNKTTNEILFDCEVDLLNGYVDYHTREAVYAFIDDFYKNKGKEINNNFSHDNWKGVACWLKEFFPDDLHKIPLLGRHSWRPDNFLFFLFIKFPLVGFLFIPIISLSHIVGALRLVRKHKGKSKHISTSGRILSFFILRHFEFFFSWEIVNYIIKNHKALSGLGWDIIFDIYFTKNHRVSKAYYAKKNELQL